MFGKIIEVHEYNIVIENVSHKVETGLVGVHIVFESQYKIVAEITKITSEYIECILVGEFTEVGFHSGITHKPLYNSLISCFTEQVGGLRKLSYSSDCYFPERYKMFSYRE